MSRMSPGLTIDAQNAARRHSTTFISTPDWSVTTMDARGTKVPAAGPDFTFNTSNIFLMGKYSEVKTLSVPVWITVLLLQYKGDKEGEGGV